jgi:hypothetical protein
MDYQEKQKRVFFLNAVVDLFCNTLSVTGGTFANGGVVDTGVAP